MANVTPYAKIITDSISRVGSRITTVEVRLHRFVLAELNTHRVFSRNSASSRAIPLRKTIESVENDLAMPLVWTYEQAGMVGSDPLDSYDQRQAELAWQRAAHSAVSEARNLRALGVHKSIANRLLEPFMWHTVIITSTEWENFFAQRCHPAAQPEIRVPAEMIRDAMRKSEPVVKATLEWHLPYVQPDELDAYTRDELVKISTARCARVSYLTHDGVRSVEKDIELYEKLISASPPHASPMEHPACAGLGRERSRNFVGWISHRALIGI